MYPTFLRLLPLIGALLWSTGASAQTAPGVPPAPSAPTNSVTQTPGRFTDLTQAPAAIASAAQTVTGLVDAVRASATGPSAAATVSLTAAVTQANTAIIREGQAVRSEALASRQATLTRLRLAQSETERLRLLDDLRLQSGERLDDQREVARLVRDRLRQVRDDAVISRPTTPTP